MNDHFHEKFSAHVAIRGSEDLFFGVGGFLMLTCYVRHAPFHSPPAPLSPMLAALPDRGTMWSFLPVGRVYIPSPIKLNLKPAHRGSNRTLTAMLTLTPGASHHTPFCFHLGGFERRKFLFRSAGKETTFVWGDSFHQNGNTWLFCTRVCFVTHICPLQWQSNCHCVCLCVWLMGCGFSCG